MKTYIAVGYAVLGCWVHQHVGGWCGAGVCCFVGWGIQVVLNTVCFQGERVQ